MVTPNNHLRPVSLLKRACKVCAGLTGAGFLLTAAGFAQSPVTVTIDTEAHGYRIPDDFTGVGFETWAEEPDRSGVSGRLFSPTNTQLITLFTNSGIRNLRLGGCTVDGLQATVPTHADIDSAFGFAQAAHIKIIYSLRLLNGDPAEDVEAARYVWTHYRPWLVAFAIGNEPDVKGYVYPPFGKGTDPAITNYTSYLAAWRTFADAVTKAVPGAPLAGPDAAGTGGAWAPRFTEDEAASGWVKLITQHGYVGGAPFIKGRVNLPVQQAIDNMLSEDWVTNKYPAYYAKTLGRIAASGLPFRMTEANDYLHGVTNASNAFASALWALDYMHWWAAHGSAGVNFHNNQQFEWLTTDTLYLDRSSRTYQIYPKAYAIKAFDLASHGQVKSGEIANPEGLNLTAYAVGGPDDLYVTVINKEHGPAARSATVTLATGGFSTRNAAVMFLLAPNSDAGATNGITLGGSPITNNAPWQGSWTTLNPPTNRQYQVMVPAASAAIVRLRRN